jgi:hypothetical protein
MRDITLKTTPHKFDTNALYASKRSDPPESSTLVLEVLDAWPDEVGDQLAGDREWEFADAFGYPRKNHYTQIWDSMLTSEELSEFGTLGNKVRGDQLKDTRKKSGMGIENNDWYTGSVMLLKVRL